MPITIVGRILAGGVMICGIALFALWAGILANGFAEEIRRRTCCGPGISVTKVPSSTTSATAPSPRSRACCGRANTGGLHDHAARRAGRPHVLPGVGEVEIRIRPTPRRLGPGDFFGEIALVTGAPRNATAVATRYCVLLGLHLTDFRHLAARKPELTEMINREASRRLAEGVIAPVIADAVPDGM